MRKIPTMFRREGRFVVDKVADDCLWVLGSSPAPATVRATEKLDGTNVRLTVRSGMCVRLEKRRNPTKERKSVGVVDPWYVDAHMDDPEDKWIVRAEARSAFSIVDWPDGEHSCEAIGPKIQGNPLGLETAVCVPFMMDPRFWGGVSTPVYAMDERQRSFENIKAYLWDLGSLFSPGHLAEGIVFHNRDDGRMCKIKRKDFDYG